MFCLSKENLDLAINEVLALTKNIKFMTFDNLLVLDTDLDLKNRLAYIHSIYKFLFKEKVTEFKKKN